MVEVLRSLLHWEAIIISMVKALHYIPNSCVHEVFVTGAAESSEKARNHQQNRESLLHIERLTISAFL